MEALNLFVPLTKVDIAQRLVYGTLAAEVADHSGEIMDYDTAKPAFKAWSDEIAKSTDGKSLGNVRAMHKDIAAGKLISIDFDDENKKVIGCAKIIDNNEWEKVLEGVYTGFSMGGAYAKRWACPANANLKRYTPKVAEVSIVDNPCIPVATFEVIKADGSHEMRKFKVAADADADLKQVWQARDGTTFTKKAEALQKNIDLAATATLAPVQAAIDAMGALKKAQDALAAKEPEMEIQHGEPETARTHDIPVITPSPLPVIEQSPDEKFAAFTAAAKKMVLSKQLCDLPMLVDIIYNLQWLQSNLEWDNLYAADSVTTLPSNCQTILADLCTLLKAMVDEATKDITEEAAKAISFDQAETLRKFTGKADLLPTITAPVAAEQPADLEKVRTEHAAELQKFQNDLAASTAREETLKNSLTEMTSGMGDLMKRISALEAQPVPAKAIKNTTVITKGHEGEATGADTASVEALAKSFSHLPPAEGRAEFAKAMAQLSQ